MKAVSIGHQIIPQILAWSHHEPSLNCESGCCAISTSQGTLLVDPLPMETPALQQLESFGRPTAILLTNGNHQRDSLLFQQRWGIPILAHEEARSELTADKWFTDGQTICGNIDLLHLPGAGSGEIALIQTNAFCVFGDFLVHTTPGHLELLPDQYCNNPEQARTSLKRLRQIKAPVLVFAHGIPITNEGSQRVQALLQEYIAKTV